MLKTAALLEHTLPDDAYILSAVYFGGACFWLEFCRMLICASTLANRDKAVNRVIMLQIFVEASLLK